MTIIKLIGIAIIGVIIICILKTAKPEFAVLATIATGIILIIVMVNSLNTVIVSFQKIIDKSGLPSELYTLVLKIIGIGYLTEYSASICDDAGCGTLGSKIQLGGKLTIFGLSIGIITKLIEIVAKMGELL